MQGRGAGATARFGRRCGTPERSGSVIGPSWSPRESRSIRSGIWIWLEIGFVFEIARASGLRAPTGFAPERAHPGARLPVDQVRRARSLRRGARGHLGSDLDVMQRVTINSDTAPVALPE